MSFYVQYRGVWFSPQFLIFYRVNSLVYSVCGGGLTNNMLVHKVLN